MLFYKLTKLSASVNPFIYIHICLSFINMVNSVCYSFYAHFVKTWTFTESRNLIMDLRHFRKKMLYPEHRCCSSFSFVWRAVPPPSWSADRAHPATAGPHTAPPQADPQLRSQPKTYRDAMKLSANCSLQSLLPPAGQTCNFQRKESQRLEAFGGRDMGTKTADTIKAKKRLKK